MRYAIGDQVDGYVLTERGWVPRLELDTSPFRPGHVVNDAILTGALEWRPLRTAPVAPYEVGDVVEGYVLVPSGDWLPLAGQVRDSSGAPRATTLPDGSTTQARSAASVRTTQTQARPQTRPRAQARPQPQPQPQYRIGQVVSGHVLTADRGWVPLPRGQAQRAPGRPATKSPATKNNDTIGRVLFVAVAIIVLMLIRSCA